LKHQNQNNHAAVEHLKAIFSPLRGYGFEGYLSPWVDTHGYSNITLSGFWGNYCLVIQPLIGMINVRSTH